MLKAWTSPSLVTRQALLPLLWAPTLHVRCPPPSPVPSFHSPAGGGGSSLGRTKPLDLAFPPPS